MIMRPHHSATIRIKEQGIYDFHRTVSDVIAIAIMVQDVPVAGTRLSAPFLTRMVREIEN